MCKHEEKICPRCDCKFECKTGDIFKCQCYAVPLTEEESKFIATRFTDCLCAACMIALKTEYQLLQNKIQLNAFFNGR